MSPDSSHRFDQPLHVELQASRLLTGAVSLFYALAALCCFRMPLPAALCTGLCALLGLNFVRLYRLHIGATGAAAIRALSWDPAAGWRLRGPGGDWENVALCTPVFVSYRLAMARFRCGRWRTRSVIVVGDRLGGDDFRRLRVRLIQSAHGDRDRKEIPGQR